MSPVIVGVGAAVFAAVMWRWATGLLTVPRPRWFHPAVAPALGGVLALAMAPLFDGLAAGLAVALWGAGAAYLVMVDLAEKHLPDPLNGWSWLLIAVTVGIQSVAEGTWTLWARSLTASVIVTVVLFAAAWFSGGRFNLGDVKLGAVLGLLLGALSWAAVLYGMLAGFAVGALVSIALLVGRRASRATEYPFGPCMIIGSIAGAWYAHLLT